MNTFSGESGWMNEGFDIGNAGWIHGLIVSQAILGMGQKLTPDRNRITIAVIVAGLSLLWQTAYSQVLLILVAGLIGVWFYRSTKVEQAPQLPITISKSFAISCLLMYVALLLTLPLLRQWGQSDGLAWFDSFYRSGSLVFGGGHVVLPLLEQEVVSLRNNPTIQGALTGVNAAVVGLLLAALYDPLWITAIVQPADFALAALLFILLVFWKLPPWMVVLAGAAGGMLLGLV